MNAKAYFAQARSLPVQIQAKMKQLQAVRTLQEPLAALPEASKTLSDLAADITAEVQAYAALQRQLQTLIDSLPVPESRTLLELRYLSGSKWEEMPRRCPCMCDGSIGCTAEPYRRHKKS